VIIFESTYATGERKIAIFFPTGIVLGASNFRGISQTLSGLVA
jgi:hypothetical protein